MATGHINVIVDVVNGKMAANPLVDARREWEGFSAARGRFGAVLRAIRDLFGGSVYGAVQGAAEVMEEMAIDMHTSYEEAIAELMADRLSDAAHDRERVESAERQIRELEHCLFRIVEDVRKHHADAVAIAGSAVVPPWFRRAAALGHDHSQGDESITEPCGWTDEEPF